MLALITSLLPVSLYGAMELWDGGSYGY